MKEIKIHQMHYAIEALYSKAKTKSQRALLGYMVKGGHATDPIYGGAFRLVREIESFAGIYVLATDESFKDTTEIIRIAESAMSGLWDEFAFSEREISTILIQLYNLNKKGGR
jgi:hypothetical protein